MSSNPIVFCESLIKVYSIAGIEVQALQGLGLSVASGEYLGIVGASGSGKTTLLNIVGGLDRPTAGRIWVDDQNLLTLDGRGMNRYRRHMVGFVWQQATRNLVPYLTALENVQLPLTLSGHSGRAARQRAEGLLKTVGLAERGHHRLAELSGGEQQRVAIARAIVNHPSILLADEPTGNLDTENSNIVLSVLRDLNERVGQTILMITHNPEAADYAHRTVHMRDGRIVV